MLHQKNIFLFFFLTIIGCSPRCLQQTTLFISDQKLNVIFNNRSCIYNQRLDNSVLWEEDYGIQFLLRKLKSENYRDQSLAISYLSNTKDAKFIEVIASYLESPNHLVAMSAVRATKIISMDYLGGKYFEEKAFWISDELKHSKKMEKARTAAFLKRPFGTRNTEDF